MEPIDALVIGAGPAGLMAAEELSAAGRRVLVADTKPSPARKFLMAGKSGLNLTKDEPLDVFVGHYGAAADWLRPVLEELGPEQAVRWAEALGQPMFTGSTGRVFPRAMKGSPLLRAWLSRLDAQGVELRTRWRWTGWAGDAPAFDTPEGPQYLKPRVTVLALGGASWSRLGSDGAWRETLIVRGVPVAPFRPANVGLVLDWSDHMARHFGAAVKGVRLIAGGMESRGEFVVSARGLEGGGIYSVVAAVRDGAPLFFDLAPDLPPAEVVRRLSGGKRGESLANRLRKALNLSPVVLALMQEFGRPLPAEPEPLAERVKRLPVRHAGPRPMDEAISTAGGITRDALDDSLMIRALPGVFAAGEMLDWEAPTGGYLLTACLATGRHAGRAAARWR